MRNKSLKMSIMIMLAALNVDAVESNSIGVFVAPERSVLYRTLSSEVLTLPVDLAAYDADYAELDISGMNYRGTFVCEGESNFTVSLPAVSETSEDVYDLTLTYFKEGKSKAVRTTTLGRVFSCGSRSAVAKVCDPESVRWNLSRCHAVLPVPYGAVSVSIGESVRELDGNAGWFGCKFTRSADPVHLCLVTLDGDNGVMVTPSLISGLILSLR